MRWLTNIYFIYSMSCAVLPCAVHQIISEIKYRKTGKRNSAAHFVWLAVLLFYLSMVFDVTGSGTLSDLLRPELGFPVGDINLVPFDSVDIRYLLNIIMFMPFGFLVPLIWRPCQRCVKTVLTGTFFSLLIEITQLCDYRTSDIDDLIANTLGALLGYMIWRVFAAVCSRWISKEHFRWASENGGAVFCIVLAMAGKFFLYNPYLLL